MDAIPFSTSGSGWGITIGFSINSGTVPSLPPYGHCITEWQWFLSTSPGSTSPTIASGTIAGSGGGGTGTLPPYLAITKDVYPSLEQNTDYWFYIGVFSSGDNTQCDVDGYGTPWGGGDDGSAGPIKATSGASTACALLNCEGASSINPDQTTGGSGKRPSKWEDSNITVFGLKSSSKDYASWENPGTSADKFNTGFKIQFGVQGKPDDASGYLNTLINCDLLTKGCFDQITVHISQSTDCECGCNAGFMAAKNGASSKTGAPPPAPPFAPSDSYFMQWTFRRSPGPATPYPNARAAGIFVLIETSTLTYTGTNPATMDDGPGGKWPRSTTSSSLSTWPNELMDPGVMTYGWDSQTVSGTYDVSPTGGTGTNAELTIVVAQYTVSTVTVTNAGTGYLAGDILTVPAALLGGGSQPLTFTLESLSLESQYEGMMYPSFDTNQMFSIPAYYWDQAATT
ncbi:MAG: hypothetical protein KAJ19_08695, partial [Gammaproteobacteria bacterium]|nr:hypothetical protein [Gammaproteobacteria bacterium]